MHPQAGFEQGSLGVPLLEFEATTVGLKSHVIVKYPGINIITLAIVLNSARCKNVGEKINYYNTINVIIS